MLGSKQKLDDESLYRKYDTDGVLESLGQIPDQILQAWEEMDDVALPPFQPKIVVVSGMGGSGLGPHILQTSFGSQVRVPVVISNGYMLPGYVGEKTLLVSVSYSGNTEEAVTAYKEAGFRGAQRLVITTGGALARLAGHDKVPLYKFNPKHNPCGQPRMGLGYPLGALARILERYKLADFLSGDMPEAAEHMRSIFEHVQFSTPFHENIAKQLATRLEEAIPVFIGTRFLKGALHTAVNQMHENAKHFAMYFPLPELNHHLLEALSNPRGLSQAIHAVFFDSPLAHPLVRERTEVTRAVFKKQGIATDLYNLTGDDSLSASLELVAIGGAIGVYLALLHKQNPSKIPWVDYFKEHLG